MNDENENSTTIDAVTCLHCDRVLAEGEDREATDGGVFCRACYDTLRGQLEDALARQGEGINFVNAVAGAVVGGLAGAAVWWGFTVLTGIAFGLVAVVIGFAAGKGVTLAVGGRRAVSLQVIAASVTAVAYFLASYLVNRTYILRAMEDDPTLRYSGLNLPLLPPPELWFNVVKLNFGFFDVIFLAFAVWQAWKMPRPFRLTD